MIRRRALSPKIAVLVSLVSAQLTLAQEDIAEPPSLEPPPAEATGPNPFSALNLDALGATRDMPLFTPSRTAPVVEAELPPEPLPVETPPEPEAPPEMPAGPPPLKLIGVMMMPSEQLAILSNEGTGEVQRLKPGETFENWTLQIVDARTVAFESGDERHVLKMFSPGTEPPPAPGARTPVPEDAFQSEQFGADGEALEQGISDPTMDPQGPVRNRRNRQGQVQQETGDTPPPEADENNSDPTAGGDPMAGNDPATTGDPATGADPTAIEPEETLSEEALQDEF